MPQIPVPVSTSVKFGAQVDMPILQLVEHVAHKIKKLLPTHIFPYHGAVFVPDLYPINFLQFKKGVAIPHIFPQKIEISQIVALGIRTDQLSFAWEQQVAKANKQDKNCSFHRRAARLIYQVPLL